MNFFWRKIAMIAGCAAVLALAGGCSWMPWVEASQNVENSRRLRIGQTKSEVLAIMGEPVSDEIYCTPDVWFYFIQTVWMDGLTTEDECMPLVFEDGKLIGWGNEFYTNYRYQRKQGGTALEI